MNVQHALIIVLLNDINKDEDLTMYIKKKKWADYTHDEDKLMWKVIIHMTFVLSGLLFALMDKIVGDTKKHWEILRYIAISKFPNSCFSFLL